MNFDEIIERRGTHSAKWDMMEPVYGVSPAEGIPMWVADMDFRPPACVQKAVEGMAAHGVYGYFGDDTAYLDAVRWWMRERHGWAVEPGWIGTTHGFQTHCRQRASRRRFATGSRRCPDSGKTW